jgi:glycosyltransferase involved in cell wall biosynthesis
VGRLIHPAKGHDDLLAAAARVVRAAPSARFLVVGDGAREAELRAAAARHGVAANVVFLGRRADVPALLRRADVVCHPARAEGLPNAVLEAMAAARPIVATAAGGTPELVEDGRHGLLVPTCDPAALAGGVVALIRDPARARALGLAARRRVEDELTVGHLVARVDALYARLAR